MTQQELNQVLKDMAQLDPQTMDAEDVLTMQAAIVNLALTMKPLLVKYVYSTPGTQTFLLRL